MINKEHLIFGALVATGVAGLVLTGMNPKIKKFEQPHISNSSHKTNIVEKEVPQKTKEKIEEQQKEIEKLKAHPIIAPF